ncbi:hypothetical protein GF386_01315 [Candidatus Pacearchaeota archaeon]|nr:hypothetical protein [Candidatus Pacearchaeota archaeon]
MEPLRVRIIDNNLERARRLEARLQEPGPLDSFDVRYSCSRHNGEDTGELARTGDDLFIVNHNLIRHNDKLFYELEDLNRHWRRNIIMAHNRNSKNVPYEIADRVFESPNFKGNVYQDTETEEMQELLKKSFYRPPRVAILGLGTLGIDFALTLLLEGGIRSLKGYSKSKEARDRFRDIFDNFCVSNSDSGCADSLEDAVADADCVLLCSSFKRGTVLEKLAKRKDRLDLLEKEGPKAYGYFQELARVGYKGLVLTFPNPVGPICQVGVRAGLESGQLSFPFNIDRIRVKNILLRDLESYFGSQDEAGYVVRSFVFPEHHRHGKKRDFFVVGEHGTPIVSKPADPQNNDYNGISSQAFYAMLDSAAAESIKIAPRAMAFGRIWEIIGEDLRSKGEDDSHIPYFSYSVVRPTLRFFETMANLNEKPDVSCYCAFETNGINGFLALPARISYFPYTRVEPDYETVGRFDLNTMRKLETQLSMQNTSVENHMEISPENEGIFDESQVISDVLRRFR